MRAAVERAGLAVDVDSAGTGDWHVGKPPDRRAIATAARHGIDISDLRARQVRATDFETFDRLIALDRKNLDDLRLIIPATYSAELSMLLDHVEGRHGQDVADPYFGADEGFDAAWRDIMLGVEGLVAELSGQPSR